MSRSASARRWPNCCKPPAGIRPARQSFASVHSLSRVVTVLQTASIVAETATLWRWKHLLTTTRYLAITAVPQKARSPAKDIFCKFCGDLLHANTMPAATAIGGALFAYGPSAVFFFGFISPRSQLLVMSILSAFVWVLAISVAGLVWAAIPPLQGATGFHAPVAVILQVSG